MKKLTTTIALFTIALFNTNTFAAQTQNALNLQLKNEVNAQIKTVIAIQLNDALNTQSFAPKLTLAKVNTQWTLAKNTITEANTRIKAIDLAE